MPVRNASVQIHRLLDWFDTHVASSVNWSPRLVWPLACLGVLVIGLVDYETGTELRVFPLYYAPVGLVAWARGRPAAVIVAALSAGCWLGSNFLAGLRFSTATLWLANTLTQGLSFAAVGVLVASLRKALIRERFLSRTDPLTGLLNGRAFHESATPLLTLCRRRKHPVTVAYIDLDNFKTVNDNAGHHAGDDLLRRIADLLRVSVRPCDLLARLGGDEFALFLPQTARPDAAAAMERLHSLLEQLFATMPLPLGATIGAVTFLSVPEDLDVLIREADARMYAAKSRGKGRVHLEVLEGEGRASTYVSGEM